MLPNNGEYLAGFIDLGTNSVRLLIVAVTDEGLYRVILSHKEMVRLGEGAYSRGYLSEEAVDRTVAALKLIAKTCKDLEVREITAIATAATRDAKNAAEFLTKVRQETKIALEVIPGKEEARLIYRGVAGGLPIGRQNALFIDIGGGSTEIVLANANDYFFLESLNCGCVRYTNRFFDDGYAGPISSKKYHKICEQVNKNALHTLNALKKEQIDLAVGSSGTIENLAEIAIRKKNPALRLNNLPPEERKLSLKDIQCLAEKLCSLSLEERRALPGINPKRADVIIAGAAIIQTLMEELKLPEIWVSDRGLQHGLLMDYLRSERFGVRNSKISVREFSVLQLLKRSGTQENHARHVAALALSIFDDAKIIDLFNPEEGERELLYYAALLHDTGTMLSLNHHNIHSHYFIKNSELLGFYAREINIIAASTYFHGKKALRGTEGIPLSLDVEAVSKRHGAIIYLCEALDRTHRGLIERVTLNFFEKDKKHLALNLKGSHKNDCIVELTATRDSLALIERQFGKKFKIIFEESEFPT